MAPIHKFDTVYVQGCVAKYNRKHLANSRIRYKWGLIERGLIREGVYSQNYVTGRHLAAF